MPFIKHSKFILKLIVIIIGAGIVVTDIAFNIALAAILHPIRTSFKLIALLAIVIQVIDWTETKSHALQSWMHSIPTSMWILAALVVILIISVTVKMIFIKPSTKTDEENQ